MKRPQFSLRLLLVVVGIVAAIMGWIESQREWIRQRHLFFATYQVNRTMHDTFPRPHPSCPWQLSLFGEAPHDYLDVPPERMAEAQRLFPEAIVCKAFLGVGEKWPHDNE
jgi:hypothetical protein